MYMHAYMHIHANIYAQLKIQSRLNGCVSTIATYIHTRAYIYAYMFTCGRHIYADRDRRIRIYACIWAYIRTYLLFGWVQPMAHPLHRNRPKSCPTLHNHLQLPSCLRTCMHDECVHIYEHIYICMQTVHGTCLIIVHLYMNTYISI